MIRDSERRCAAVLLRLGSAVLLGPDDEEPVDFSFTQDELAGAANLSRNSARRHPENDWRSAVWSKLGYRAKIVCFPKALRAFVEQG